MTDALTLTVTVTVTDYCDIDVREWYYPSSICAKCRIYCSPVNGNSRKVVLHKYKFNYSKSTRTNSKCTCEVCEAAQLKYGKNLPGTVPRKENQRKSKPSNLSTTKVIREVIRMCNTCLTEIGRGNNHVCTVTERSENLARILKENYSSPKASEAAVSKFLAEKVSTSGSENIRLSNRRGKPSVFLKANSNVSLKERKRMRTEDMFKVKTENNLSMRKTLGIMKGLKRGGVSFETGLKGKLSKLNSQLGDLFSIVELGEVAKAENVHLGQYADVPVIFCNNIPELLQRIKKSRHASEEELFIKLGIDGGGGFFKITLSLSVVSKTQNNSADYFKDSGVKRLHILALAPNLAEKYEYIFLIWNGLLKLLESIIAGDLKIINVIIGIMAHSSTHPCPYCVTEKSNLALLSGVLKHFQNAYKKCFSFELVPGFEEDINKFVEYWEMLHLPKSSKYHITKFHVKEFCNATGQGLGWHNEQASESVHSDFLLTWERYKTTKTSKIYKSQLLRAVVDYNSGHLC
ncbi:uncharacterized protein LOC135709769 [Ochlerotatus camptorhynchus]|uniref:uncharacterized protein LOC135709769 n=1 Tax=Ochlerotatus camptorhynchus TaxID=644619 RepID=UPI0031E068B3